VRQLWALRWRCSAGAAGRRVQQEVEQEGSLMGRRVGFFLPEDLHHAGPKVG
jgi:hypothetical protein